MSVIAPPAPLVLREAATVPVDPAAVPVRRRRVPRWTSWFLVTLTLYLVVGVLLAFHYQSFNGDAQARTANAYYVLFSRDPHLAAIGFVWNPLPSMAVLPLLIFSPLWPALSQYAFAGNIMSAVFMAGAVVQLRAIFADIRVRRSTAVILTLLFALHPMIVYYGGNGMSEGLFLFTLVASTRYLMRYLATGSVASLVRAGVWLGVAYYARNEAVAAAGFTGLVVLVVAYIRCPGERQARVRRAIVDTMIVSLPPLFAFVTWAAASWVIVGHPFEQFSSQYGTSSQLQVMQDAGAKLGGNGGFALKMTVLMAPMAGVAAILALVKGHRTKDLREFGALAVLGGALAFAVVGFTEGQTAGWFRYFIAATALSAVLAGLCFADTAPRPAVAGQISDRPRRALAKSGGAIFSALFAIVLLGPSIPSAGAAMRDPHTGREEYPLLSAVFHTRSDVVASGTCVTVPCFSRSVALAKYLDGLKLPDSSIIVDTFTPCVPFMILASHHPKQFIITNDRDFKPILADPVTFKARYLLVPVPTGDGLLDALNVAYPDLYATGAQIATKAADLTGPGCPNFRLYAVTPNP